MATLIQLQIRRDTAANWASTNPTLLAGEIGYDTTNKMSKIGTGSTAWNSLAFSGGAPTQDYTFTISKVGSTYFAIPRVNSGFSQYSGTDCYTVIQAAINALTPSGGNGSGGGSIKICQGDYGLSNELTIVGWEGIVGSSSQPNSQIVIEGDGMSTYLYQNTASKNVFKINNCANFALRDMKLYAGSSAKSCILGDNDGSTSVMSCWKSVIDNVHCHSNSTVAPAVLIKDFFELSVPWLRAYCTGHSGVVLQQTDTLVKRGNSWIGSLVSAGANSSPHAGLKLECTTASSVIDMITIDNYQCTTPTWYGIYLYGAQYNNFLFTDIEAAKYCVYADGPSSGSYQYSSNNTFYSGYWQPADNGEGYHGTTHAVANTINGVAIYTRGDGSVKAINDLNTGGASDYKINMPNSAAPDLAANFIGYAGTRLQIIGSSSYTERLPNGTTATTQATTDSSTKLATTAFVASQAGPTGVINVKNYGAVGDGTTNDSAAFAAAYTAATTTQLSTFSYSGWNRLTKAIYIPAGTYLINSNASLLSNITSASGLKYYGDGQEVTEIVFAPTAANGYLCDNQDDLQELVFEDMTFYGSGANAATATFMKSYSTGHAQNYVFNRCTWGGTWKYGLDLTGTDNNSEMTFFQCQIQGAWTAFLYCGSAVTGGDQFLNYDFFKCIYATTTGNFVDMAYGGSINVWGGSYIHLGNGTETTSAAQCFFKLGASGVDHYAGTPQLNVQGIRVEHRHNNSQLINSEWKSGNIAFRSCITNSNQPLNADPTAIVQAKFHTAQELPVIVWDNCSLMGKHQYYNGSGTYNWQSGIHYNGCYIATFETADAFITTTTEGGGPPAGLPLVRFTNCKAKSADINEVFDCNINWQSRINATVERRVVSVKKPGGGLPGDGWGSTVTIKLPINAVITRVTAFKPAGGSATSTTFTYTLTNADAATVATAAGGGSAWNAAWSYDSGQLYYIASTTNRRTLTLTSANITEAATNNLFLIEYIA